MISDEPDFGNMNLNIMQLYMTRSMPDYMYADSRIFTTEEEFLSNLNSAFTLQDKDMLKTSIRDMIGQIPEEERLLIRYNDNLSTQLVKMMHYDRKYQDPQSARGDFLRLAAGTFRGDKFVSERTFYQKDFFRDFLGIGYTQTYTDFNTLVQMVTYKKVFDASSRRLRRIYIWVVNEDEMVDADILKLLERDMLKDIEMDYRIEMMSKGGKFFHGGMTFRYDKVNTMLFGWRIVYQKLAWRIDMFPMEHLKDVSFRMVQKYYLFTSKDLKKSLNIPINKVRTTLNPDSGSSEESETTYLEKFSENALDFDELSDLFVYKNWLSEESIMHEDESKKLSKTYNAVELSTMMEAYEGLEENDYGLSIIQESIEVLNPDLFAEFATLSAEMKSEMETSTSSEKEDVAIDVDMAPEMLSIIEKIENLDNAPNIEEPEVKGPSVRLQRIMHVMTSLIIKKRLYFDKEKFGLYAKRYPATAPLILWNSIRWAFREYMLAEEFIEIIFMSFYQKVQVEFRLSHTFKISNFSMERMISNSQKSWLSNMVYVVVEANEEEIEEELP